MNANMSAMTVAELRLQETLAEAMLRNARLELASREMEDYLRLTMRQYKTPSKMSAAETFGLAESIIRTCAYLSNNRMKLGLTTGDRMFRFEVINNRLHASWNTRAEDHSIVRVKYVVNHEFMIFGMRMPHALNILYARPIDWFQF